MSLASSQMHSVIESAWFEGRKNVSKSNVIMPSIPVLPLPVAPFHPSPHQMKTSIYIYNWWWEAATSFSILFFQCFKCFHKTWKKLKYFFFSLIFLVYIRIHDDQKNRNINVSNKSDYIAEGRHNSNSNPYWVENTFHLHINFSRKENIYAKLSMGIYDKLRSLPSQFISSASAMEE